MSYRTLQVEERDFRALVFTGTGTTFCVGADGATFQLTSVSIDVRSARALESFGQSIPLKTSNRREGVDAFAGKRRPTFTGE